MQALSSSLEVIMQVNGNSVRLLSMVALSASYVKIKPMNKYSLAALNTRARSLKTAVGKHEKRHVHLKDF